MNNLYTELATVYEAMYHTFIDYKEEHQFYSDLIKKFLHRNGEFDCWIIYFSPNIEDIYFVNYEFP